MNKKVLVTGGSGFLGINMIRYLLHQGVTDITVLDLVEFDYPERDRINSAVRLLACIPFLNSRLPDAALNEIHGRQGVVPAE